MGEKKLGRPGRDLEARLNRRELMRTFPTWYFPMGLEFSGAHRSLSTFWKIDSVG